MSAAQPLPTNSSRRRGRKRCVGGRGSGIVCDCGCRAVCLAMFCLRPGPRKSWPLVVHEHAPQVSGVIRSICVFCGSANGVAPMYFDAARAFATVAAERGLRLVYGGASVGLMGALADAGLAAGGE